MLSDMEIMAKIATKSGFYKTLETSTGQLSQQLQVSQQTVSRRLRELETLGFIKRELRANGMDLRLTVQGKKALEQEYTLLKAVFESPKEMLEGKVISGDGEGAYYVKQYSEKIQSCLGFTPYPGTLNVHVGGEARALFINKLNGCKVEKFKTKEREFGGIDCYSIRIGELEAGIIVPHRTRHGNDVLEIVAPVYLRGHFSLKDHDPLELQAEEVK